MSKPTTKADTVTETPVETPALVPPVEAVDPVEAMLRSGQIKITPKGESNWPGNYKALNDRQVMNLVKMVQDGKAHRPETIRAILREAVERSLISA